MTLYKDYKGSLVLMIALLIAGRAYADDVMVGANLVNEPYKLTADEQETILNALDSAGIRVIRSSISNNDKGVEYAQRVNAHSIKIELIVGIKPAAGTPWPHAPKGFKAMWEGYPLSKSDPDAFRAYFAPLLAKLEAKGITFAAFELGNEINWAGFNADFSLPGEGRVLDADDLNNDPEGQQVAQGYLQYMKVLAVLKDIRDHSTLNQHTPIITAGLADLGGSTWTQKVRADAVTINATLDFFRAHGLDNLVDGYGIHNYPTSVGPGTSEGAAQRRKHTEINGLDECQPAGSTSGKPCWFTEWGIGALSTKCPVDDSNRIMLVDEMRDYYSQLAHQGRLKALFFFNWQGFIHALYEDTASAYRCGALTESGRRALAPLS